MEVGQLVTKQDQDSGLPQMERLLGVMARLRDPDGGCPWDLKQDLKSLRPYVIEEAFEVVEAMDSGDSKAHCAELGDLLFQVVFQARLAEEEGVFDFEGVARAVGDKMVSRHPHVFGDKKVAGALEVVKNWEEIKAAERKNRGALSGVPDALPALLRGQRVGEKAAAMGFDWEDKAGVVAKVHEEWSELEAATALQDRRAMEHELGDLLFTLANLARHLGLDAESSLQGAVRRFKGRFEFMERALQEREGIMAEQSPDELQALWDAAKEATGEEKTQGTAR
jgi:MazG family protein